MTDKPNKSNWLLILVTTVAVVALTSTLFLRVEHQLTTLNTDFHKT